MVGGTAHSEDEPWRLSFSVCSKLTTILMTMISISICISIRISISTSIRDWAHSAPPQIHRFGADSSIWSRFIDLEGGA